jgi:hypothetical protein
MLYPGDGGAVDVCKSERVQMLTFSLNWRSLTLLAIGGHRRPQSSGTAACRMLTPASGKAAGAGDLV